MKNKNNNGFRMGLGNLAAFVCWTVLVQFLDVQRIGPMGSTVGLATVNQWFHNLTGVHMWLYILTDWLSLIPLGIVLWFAALGLIQWIQRRSLMAVDRDILLLGGFYAAVFLAYAFFEQFVINYRPILIENLLEASYPSSTTMLVLCVMSTAVMQGKRRIRQRYMKNFFACLVWAYTTGMVIGRLMSGVHWLTDIIGGILLSVGLVMLYSALCRKYCRNDNRI